MMDTGATNFADLASARDRARDTSRPVALIGFQKQENLGLGYLAATLSIHGYQALVLDFEQDPAEILAEIKRHDPIIVGFSLIFQFYLPRFQSLVRFLRHAGVGCHFTMGGHFPSLSYQHALDLLPELDSIVRFEGELTLLEMADVLSTGQDYRTISGIAYRGDNGVVTTPMRPLVTDLDQLPFPVRRHERHALLGHCAAQILASRGCIRTCSFCSIHMFYRSAPGKVVRTRKPARVVEEMRLLHEQHGITIFMFQDDDFPVFGPVWRRWANEFVDELHRNRLPGRVIWKINCRADAVEPELFARMRDAGLYLVYMGLESGNEEGLKTLHKQITVEQNLRAVEILKALGMIFEFGFMLFEPSTTFASVRENLSFLRAVAGDGRTAAMFCRMVPYDGTPIKDDLLRTGRLRGDVCNPDYDFLDPKLTEFYLLLSGMLDVTGWVHGLESLSPKLNLGWAEVAVMERLYPALPGLAAYREKLRELTQESNLLLFRVVEESAQMVIDGRPSQWSEAELRRQCEGFFERFLAEREAFIFPNQTLMLEALRSHPRAEAVCA
jgi:anaerobic magnesium-protoporphyrin IX monomethyl ester cyclase